ncbi:hypothetical protein CYMTET_46315 [Cymbomonas tetramitiformis]|uniref:Uncharacterized protein n=1 Tax=Cymbomonas tetramitiformis TaxID=36881 RepID=A0AAE0EYU0_9CHLO|nr:hypothetical protein CYMTET_46315 [Cymbomonas tetramitiformis]
MLKRALAVGYCFARPASNTVASLSAHCRSVRLFLVQPPRVVLVPMEALELASLRAARSLHRPGGSGVLPDEALPLTAAPVVRHARAQVLLRPGSSLAASAAGLARAGSGGVDQGIAGLRWNRQSEEQRWLRTVDERGKCLKWTRVLDVKEQNQLKAQAEEPVAAIDPEEAYAALFIGDLKYRLKLLGIPSNGCVEKGDLIQCLAGAPSKLNELSVSELKERLNNLGISTDECVEKVDLENRLLVLASNADWLSGRGWVRQLRGNLANTEILWVDAEEYTMQVALPGRSPPSIRDLHKAAALPFESKVSWFREQCAKLRIPWDQGHVVVTVRRRARTQLSRLLSQRGGG